MEMEDIVLYAFFGGFALLAVAETLRPGRRLPSIRLWRASGLFALLVSFWVSGMVPVLFDEWLAAHQLVSARALGIAGGAVVGFLALELAIYWWHRALHRIPILWRWHQLHHSAERVDVYGAMWFHPLDIAGFTLTGSVALVLVVGVRPEAAVIASMLATMLSLFQHANLSTPRWLGWIVQRPESHSIHHQRNVHAFNYSDLPLWDIVFRTFRNPQPWSRWAQREAGFHDGASRRVGRMLLGLDVTQAQGEPQAQGEATDAEPAARLAA
jgi:sterol desaturase/sphingolipid hydroxylase (fatty acid hydroxylase superfamily)